MSGWLTVTGREGARLFLVRFAAEIRRGAAIARRPSARRMIWFILWALVRLPVAAQSMDGGIDLRKEYNVKGAFLYSFGRYASWPPAAFAGEHSPFVIGVLGESSIQGVLQQIQQTKKINNRPIEVRTIQDPQRAQGCHMLFLPQSLPAEFQREVIQLFDRTPVLLIGETDGFAEWGGIINFQVQEGSVRFEINIEAARRREISVDAKLLKLATLVTTAGTLSRGRDDGNP
jgi:hypothetical protein